MHQPEILPRLARYLMLHSSHLNNIGLLEGKMGISIFFFHYSAYTKKKIYKQFAEELIKEIYKEINTESSLYFGDGLSGIAWGIEYLVQNKFVHGDTNAVLKALDERIFEWDVRYIKDYSLEKGMEGLAYYVISRCAENVNRAIPDTYIRDLADSYQAKAPDGETKEMVLESLITILSHKQVDFNTGFFKRIILDTEIPQRNIFTDKRPLGIPHNGYVGIGLKIMQSV